MLGAGRVLISADVIFIVCVLVISSLSKRVKHKTSGGVSCAIHITKGWGNGYGSGWSCWAIGGRTARLMSRASFASAITTHATSIHGSARTAHRPAGTLLAWSMISGVHGAGSCLERDHPPLSVGGHMKLTSQPLNSRRVPCPTLCGLSDERSTAGGQLGTGGYQTSSPPPMEWARFRASPPCAGCPASLALILHSAPTGRSATSRGRPPRPTSIGGRCHVRVGGHLPRSHFFSR